VIFVFWGRSVFEKVFLYSFVRNCPSLIFIGIPNTFFNPFNSYIFAYNCVLPLENYILFFIYFLLFIFFIFLSKSGLISQNISLDVILDNWVAPLVISNIGILKIRTNFLSDGFLVLFQHSFLWRKLVNLILIFQIEIWIKDWF
jgi:hypothetical protein